MHRQRRLAGVRAGSRWRVRLKEVFLSSSAESRLLLVAVPTLLILAPWILTTARLLTLATLTGINAIGVYGLAVLYGQAGMLSIAHAALWGIGGYAGAWLLIELDLSFWVVLPIAPLLAAFAAGLLGYPAIRVSGNHLIIITFAFGELFVIVLRNGGALHTGRAEGLIVAERVPSVLGLSFTSPESFYFLVLAFLFLAVMAVYLIGVSPLGRTLRAIRENEQLASPVCINVNRYKVGVFMMSGVFAGISGLLYGYFLRHVGPELFGAFPSIQLVLMLLLGGARPLLGPLAGASVIFFLPELINVDPIESQITFGLLLILVILVLPQGLVAGIQTRYIWLKSRVVALVMQRPSATLVESAGWANGIGDMGGEDDYVLGSLPLKKSWNSRGSAGTAILEVEGLERRFGGIVALDGVDLAIDEGELVGLIGPNGSGKTTLFNVLTGVHPPRAGRVIWLGEDITGLPPHVIAQKGIGRTFQQEMAFGGVSVYENVRTAHQHAGMRDDPIAGLSTPEEIMEFTGLGGYREELASNLSYGYLRRLGLALALATQPRLLLLDEPAAGMNDQGAAALIRLIRTLPGRGITVCIIDHDMDMMMPLCGRLVVLDFGKKIAEGPPDAIRTDPKVLEVYLGGDLVELAKR